MVQGEERESGLTGRALQSPLVAMLLVAGLGAWLNFGRLSEAPYAIDEKAWMKEGERSLLQCLGRWRSWRSPDASSASRQGSYPHCCW